jgi:4-amino-4-deoxy-L-arabinose transferase-like glycosyltransferase
MPEKSATWCLTAVFAAALAVRLVFCFVAIPALGLQVGPGRADWSLTDGYLQLAVNLVEHGRYALAADAAPTTYRAPMYPWALALAYALLRDPIKAVLFVNCLASALTCVVVGAMAFLLLGKAVSFWRLAPVTFFPLSIYYCASSFSDTFSGLTFTAYFLALLWMTQRPSVRNGAIGGAAHAAACLTKAVVLPIPAAVLAYAALRRRAMTASVLTSIVVGGLLVGAWTYRNWRVSGEFVPVTGGTGYNMLIGNFMIESGRDCDSSFKYGGRRAREYVVAVSGAAIPPESLDWAAEPGGRSAEVPSAIDRLYGEAAREMLRRDPMLLVRKLAVNGVRFWYFSSSPMKSLANAAINVPVLVLAIVGMVRLARTRRAEIELLALVAVLFVLLYSAIIVHSSRFALPLAMALLPCAIASVVAPDATAGEREVRVSTR